MRKIYSLLLVMLMLPVLALAADNMGISKAVRTSATMSDYRAYVDPSILKPVANGTADSYTIGAWVNIGQAQAVDQLNNNMLIFGYGGREHCNDNGCWNLVVNSGGTMTVTGWGTQGASGAVSNSTFSFGEWHHVVVVYDTDAPSMTFYLDGTQIDQKTMTGKHEWFTNENPAIYFAGFGFNGVLDEAQIWNKALTADQVSKAYRSAAAVGGLVGLYTFDEVASGTTSQFANQSTDAQASSLNMTWEKVTGTACWSNGIAYVVSGGSYAESAPTMVEGREILPEDVTLYVMDGEGGTITVTSGDNTYDGENAAEGVTISTANELTITATPDAGYQLIGIYAVDPVTQERTEIIGGTYAPVADVIITALFTDTTHALTVANAEEIPYTITRSGETVTDLTALLSGAEYSLTLNVPDTKVLNAVRLGDEELTATNGVYTFILDSDATLTIDARAKAQYTVTINQPEGGQVTVSAGTTTIASGATVLEGTVLTLAATSNAGYQFVKFLVDGADYNTTTLTPTANVTISAVFEEGIDYCEPTVKHGGSTATSSRQNLTSIVVSDGTNSIDITPTHTNSTHNIYQDKTNNILITEPGKTITLTVDGASDWMFTYIYADWNLDGLTDADKVYSNYDGSSNKSGVGSFTFTVPADQASGTYRVRYKLDWDDQGPCAVSQAASIGEYVIDFNINIPKQTLAEARTVTVASENDVYGTVAITTPATEGNSVTTDEKTVTVKATPAEGYSFMKWTNADGETVSTSATFSYTGETDAELTAHFGYAINYTVTNGGSATVVADGSAIASGAVVAVGAEIVINARPESGMEAIVKINGTEVALEGNAYSFTAEANASIEIEFAEHVNRLHIITNGNGTVEVWTQYDADSGVAPAGSQLTNGAAIPAFDSSNYQDGEEMMILYFTPGEGEELEGVEVTINGVSYDFMVEGDTGGEYGSDNTQFGYILREDINGDVVVTANFTDKSQGIDEIGIDPANGPVEYYNLQGVRVAAENLVPGFYIVRQGTKAVKVFIANK